MSQGSVSPHLGLGWPLNSPYKLEGECVCVCACMCVCMCPCVCGGDGGGGDCERGAR